jgi:hypothetical protein
MDCGGWGRTGWGGVFDRAGPSRTPNPPTTGAADFVPEDRIEFGAAAKSELPASDIPGLLAQRSAGQSRPKSSTATEANCRMDPPSTTNRPGPRCTAPTHPGAQDAMRQYVPPPLIIAPGAVNASGFFRPGRRC